jgi:hypothetical protein
LPRDLLVSHCHVRTPAEVQSTYEFAAEIELLEGKIKWSVVYFPHRVSEVYGTNGRVPVVVTVDGHEFDRTLLPSRNGPYVVFNRTIADAVGKKRGDTVDVTVKMRHGKRTVYLPDMIRDRLIQANALDPFVTQPDYLKREQINHIMSAKKEETRVARIDRIAQRLTDG